MIHMSPRWGLGGLGVPIFYKHVTPLVLKTNEPLTIDASRFTIRILHTCRPAEAIDIIL